MAQNATEKNSNQHDTRSYINDSPMGYRAWAIWKNRNKACFEKKLIKNPLEIIFHASCPLMQYWTGLYA
jgi:hypothetical protein